MAIGIGVSSWVWTGPFTNESPGLPARVREMGFDSFSLAIEDPSHVDAKKVKAAIDASGLRPNVAGAFGPPRDLTHHDPRYHRETLDYIGALLKMCELWGAKIIVGPMYAAVGKRRPLPADQRKREWERAVKEIGYTGDCVIESFLPECHHIAALAGIWRRPAPSSDELAREGLRFLRAKLA